MERARAAALASWQRGLDKGGAAQPRRFRPGWLLAACVAVLVAVAFWRPELAPPAEVARVAAVDGAIRLRASPTLLAVNSVLRSGEEIHTGAGRVALAVGDALSLRLDRHTRLRFEGAGHVTLLSGALYVDSGGLNARTELRIDTPAGAVRHVGTQFQVQVRADGTRVQVREGRVVLAAQGRPPLDLGAGDRVQISGERVHLEHAQPSSGASWEWAAATAPGFEIENRPLSEFLAWLAREHGWQLRYGDAVLQSRAQDIRLHGSLAGLDAAGMLERAALITGVPLAVSDGSLWVGVRP
jgi:ferric-dicitrate binding protein FerR (iron transport regulator)